jgi:hypothetical protein
MGSVNKGSVSLIFSLRHVKINIYIYINICIYTYIYIYIYVYMYVYVYINRCIINMLCIIYMYVDKSNLTIEQRG